MRLQALEKKYQELVGQADNIRKQYTNTDESMTDEESAQFDTIMADADKVWAEIERERKAAALVARNTDPVDAPPHPVQGKAGKFSQETVEKQLDAVREYFKWGVSSEGEFSALNRELKTLQADLDTSGGYLVAPQVFVTQLLKNVDDLVFMRRLGNVIPLANGESLGVPSLDTDLNDADWTTELATGSQDDASSFGKRELRPHPFAKRVKVSNTLIRQALIDPEAHVRERIAYKFGITEEKGFLTGSGAGQPLGLFTAHAQGISTARDVTCGTTTAITADGLIDVKHSLKPQYWGRATWIFHRDGLKMIRKLKDGNGQYLWQPGIQAGLPGTIVDCPYVSSEYAPNTFTTGQYVGILGDMKAYWIVDSLNLTVQRLVELYAESNATGFVARAEADGMPVLEEAFARCKLA